MRKESQLEGHRWASPDRAGIPHEEWIQKVSSKGGTTEAAFDYFNQNHLKEEIKTGIEKAFERAQALAQN